MIPFTTLTSTVAPLLRNNVDTDAIIPSREMKSTGRTGLADGLFAPWRYTEDRTPDPDFVLNRPEFTQARILASGENFGCGSSREHAVWALAEWGIRAVIAESFAPIFRNNCVRNGVLPVVLVKSVIAEIAGREVTIDLPAQTVSSHQFEIDAEAKAMLVEGLDAIDLTLKHRDAIAGWTARDRVERPWVYFPPQASLGEGTRDAQRRGGGVSGDGALPLPPQASLGGSPPPATRGEDGRVPRLRRTNEGVLRARKLRRELSPTERKLWAVLRQRPGGFKFRVQHPADPYTLDFYCAAGRLCIEVDGAFHDVSDQPRRDEARDRFLAARNVATIRIPARDVTRDLDSVVRHIVREVSERAPHHHFAARNGPPPQQAGEEGR